MNGPGWEARALEAMESERAGLVFKVSRLDAVIAALRNLIELPATGPASVVTLAAAPVPARAPRLTVAGGKVESRRADLDEAILAALRSGPLSPADLCAAVKMDRAKVRGQIKQLELRGLVVSTGTTMSRRVALAPAAAKEAP